LAMIWCVTQINKSTEQVVMYLSACAILEEDAAVDRAIFRTYALFARRTARSRLTWWSGGTIVSGWSVGTGRALWSLWSGCTVISG